MDRRDAGTTEPGVGQVLVAATAAMALVVGSMGIVTPATVSGIFALLARGDGAPGAVVTVLVLMGLLLLCATVGAHLLSHVAFGVGTGRPRGEWWSVPAGALTLVELCPWPVVGDIPWAWPLLALGWCGPLARFGGLIRALAVGTGVVVVGIALTGLIVVGPITPW